jgi:hypothetical protein
LRWAFWFEDIGSLPAFAQFAAPALHLLRFATCRTATLPPVHLRFWLPARSFRADANAWVQLPAPAVHLQAALLHWFLPAVLVRVYHQHHLPFCFSTGYHRHFGDAFYLR